MPVKFPFFFFFLLLASLLLASCASGGTPPGNPTQPAEQQPCSASLVTLDGTRLELFEITSQSFQLSPNPGIFGSVRLEGNLSAIQQAVLVQGSDLHAVQLRDFITLTGYLSGSLDGKSQVGDQHIEWSNIQEATIACIPAGVEYAPPPGAEAVFYDDTAGGLPLYGLTVVQSYCTPSGEPVNGYQLCFEGTTTEHVLRVNVTQDGKVYIEYEIPLEYLVSMSWSDGIQYQSPLLGAQTLRGDFHTSWALKAEGSMMFFQGENAYGTWRIVPRGDFRVEFHPPVAPELPLEALESIGSCTTLAGATYPVRAAGGEPIQLSVNESLQQIPWQDIRQVRFFSEHSWLTSDAYQSMQFWQPVEITLLDGQVLGGDAYLKGGFITAVRPDGVRLHIPLYGLTELSLNR